MPFKNEFVEDAKYRKTQYRIASPAGRIAECLQWHQFPERRIEEIDERCDRLFRHGSKGCKIHILTMRGSPFIKN